LKIVGYQGISLLDFPGRVATILFTPGCNFRCPFCQNPDLVDPDKPAELFEEIEELLQPRLGFIDGVSITGGEPTLQKGLADFLIKIRSMGLQTKLDTNGYRPQVLKDLMDAGLLDFVAMDFKSSLERYGEAAGTAVDVSRVEETVDILLASKVEHEFRTTVVPGLVALEDVVAIAQRIAGANAYRLHQFNNKTTLDPALADVQAFTPEELDAMAEKAKEFVPDTRVRGI
jgi:pyruvate formate lyase activating enzyme